MSLNRVFNIHKDGIPCFDDKPSECVKFNIDGSKTDFIEWTDEAHSKVERTESQLKANQWDELKSLLGNQSECIFDYLDDWLTYN